MHAVAGTPIDVIASRTNYTSVLVSWTAPSQPPAGYEVFYQTSAGDYTRLSGGNTSNTELTLTDLTLEVLYSIFVVGFGEEGAPVLPSSHSNTAMIMLCELITNIGCKLLLTFFIDSAVSCSNSKLITTQLHLLFHYGVMELSRGVCC